MPFLTIVFYVFIGVVSLQLIYYGVFWFGFESKSQNKKSASNVSIPLSVLICAKNEADNLKNNLPAVLTQKYPNFEVILVNDSSWDDTLELMKLYASKDARIKVVDVKNVESFWGNKKYALTLGIKAASHPYLVFTDADCKPASNQWLQQIASGFSHEKQLVLGYGAYETVKKSWINLVTRFETVLTAMQYVSYANLGMPYMGVGRNLAYHKELFFKNAGFMSHMDIMSGDDDLFVNQVANKTNVAIVTHPKSFTVSTPKKSMLAWFIQKRRHVSTAQYYKLKHKLVLGLFYSSQLLFLGLATMLLSFSFHWPIVLGLVGFRYVFLSVVFYSITKKLKEKHLVVLWPLLEIFLVVAQFFIFSANLISRPKHWN